MNIQDQLHEPTLADFTSFIADNNAKERWLNLINYLTQIDKVKIEMRYSKDVIKKGWNLKYKKGGTSLCTLYPEQDCFSILIVLNTDTIDKFEIVKEKFSQEVVDLFEKTDLYNKTKWLMIKVNNDSILDDVINLIKLKIQQ